MAAFAAFGQFLEFRTRKAISEHHHRKHDFHETIPGQTTFGRIKVDASKLFELDPAAAEQYVVQYKDADVADDKPVNSLDPLDPLDLLELQSKYSKRRRPPET